MPELRDAGFVVSDEPTDDPALRRYLLFDGVSRLLSAAAVSQGLLLILDDVHLADPPTAALLRHLLRVDAIGKIGILAVHRVRELAPDHPIASVHRRGVARGTL